MKGDFSRLTFDVTKHFRRVLMQQGRVQLDADWNEQTAILLHYLQTLAADLIGPYAGPKDNNGFAIGSLQNVSDDFKIGGGHYYVDGILVELETVSAPIEIAQSDDGGLISKITVSALTINNIRLKEDQYLEVFAEKVPEALVKITHIDSDKRVLTVTPPFAKTDDAYRARPAVTYTTQDDYPLPLLKKLEDNKTYLVYLDLWERHIAYIEDDNIREVALGGPDTATRAKLVWQVKTEALDGRDLPDFSSNEVWRKWVVDRLQPANRGMLKARARQDRKKDTDPCIVSPESGYRGSENQLYRVEVHQGGIDKQATFKWSRDNASVVTGIASNGTELTVDNVRGLSVGQWLELTNDGQELRGEVGTLEKIKKIDCDIVSLDISTAPAPKAGVPADEAWPTKARLWNSDQMQIIEKDKDNKWITLADGVQIQFQPSTPGNQYRTGDYWLIPARVATGDAEWPGDEGHPEALPPQGVEHHYAPLAIINSGDGNITMNTELRRQTESLGKPIP